MADIRELQNDDADISEIETITGACSGALRAEEGKLLYSLARRCTGKGAIVEIGSWEGRSTIWLARGSKRGNAVTVYAIDPHTGSPEHREIYGDVWTFDNFKRNIARAGVEDIITPIVKTSEEASRAFDSPVELLFLDGAHEYDLINLDCDSWFPKLTDGGTIVFHDRNLSDVRNVVAKRVLKSKRFRDVRFPEHTSMVVAEKTGRNTAGERWRNRRLLLRDRFRQAEGRAVGASCGYSFGEPATLEISVIICTCNRKTHLQKTLESLQKLDVAPEVTHEVLIIDNGSVDGTHELLEEFMKTAPKNYDCYSQPKKGKSNALNLGILRSRGKIIAFTDDDVMVDPRWLQTLWETLTAHQKASAVQGKVLLEREPGELPAWVNPDDLLFCPYFAPDSGLAYCDKLVGANMAIRRTAFERYGVFDPRLGPGASGLGEETEFCMRLRNGGDRVLYQPDAVVYHEYDEERFTWEYWCKRIQQLAKSNAIVDISIKQKRFRRSRNWLKLVRYYMKYYAYSLINSTPKKNKYYERLRYLQNYIRQVSELCAGREV